jgi:hypothetical protein
VKKGAGEESKDINQNEIGKKALKELEEKFGPKVYKSILHKIFKIARKMKRLKNQVSLRK